MLLSACTLIVLCKLHVSLCYKPPEVLNAGFVQATSVYCYNNLLCELSCGKKTKANRTTMVCLTVLCKHSGLYYQTAYLICSCDPPLVALLMAQAASFWMSNSALASSWIKGGMICASITACTREEAVRSHEHMSVKMFQFQYRSSTICDSNHGLEEYCR